MAETRQQPDTWAAFISYASTDRERAEELARHLESAGQPCWIAPRDVRPGQEYGEEIIRGIEQSDAVVLLLSEAANGSTFVRREIERAVSKRKPIYPVRLADILPAPSLELFISTVQWIDAWDGNWDHHAGRLSAQLGGRVPSSLVAEHSEAIGAADGHDDGLFRLPAVAVLPFVNMSGDPEQEYFADGLTEDIITALSLWRSFPVIARNSTFTYKGRSVDVRRVSEEMNARYVVEGSVRKANNRIRVTAQLIDAETGHHVWAERYDRDLDDIFQIQDEITELIAGIVAPALERAERMLPSARRHQTLDAWEYLKRGMTEFYSYRKEGMERARAMFRSALELDSRFARAHAAIALSYFADIRLAHSASPTASADEGYAHARRAVELDDNEPFAHHVLGIALVVRREFERSLGALRTAYSLNPNDATIVNSLGYALILSGMPDEGVVMLDRGFRLSPRDPRNPAYFAFMAWGQFSLRQYEATMEWVRKALALRENTPEAYLLLAAAHGHLGQFEEARAALAKCEGLVPGFSHPENWPHTYARESDNRHLLDGLRKAGLAE